MKLRRDFRNAVLAVMAGLTLHSGEKPLEDLAICVLAVVIAFRMLAMIIIAGKIADQKAVMGEPETDEQEKDMGVLFTVAFLINAIPFLILASSGFVIMGTIGVIVSSLAFAGKAISDDLAQAIANGKG